MADDAAETSEIDQATLRDAAIGFLARREHSQAELGDKLTRRFGRDIDWRPVVSALADEGLQSDARYAEARVRSRIASGFGPLKIRNELRRAGVGPELAEQALEGAGVQWSAHAAQVLAGKFRAPASDRREMAKQSRFLAARGFPSSLIADLLLG